MVDLHVHPAALDEFVEATAFYEERASGLGEDFFEEVQRVWRSIRENPEIAPESNHRTDATSVAAFPSVSSIVETPTVSAFWQ